MKKEIKGFIVGCIVSTIGITSVFAAGGIKSAQFNTNKIIFNGQTLDLSSQPMISVVKDGEENFSNYMPVRAVLEQMGYVVDWDSNTNTVVISDKNYNSQTTNTTNNEDFYYKLAKEVVAELNKTLKNPNSLTIHAIYGGNIYNGPDKPYLEVIMIDYSAMNSMGGYTRTYLMAWYNKIGTISSSEEYHTPSDIKESITLDINKVVE